MQKKLQLGSIIGGILGILLFFVNLNEGKGFRESFANIFVGLIIGIAGTFWFTRNMDENGETVERSVDEQINSLQNELRGNLQAAAGYESRGDHATAAHMRSYAAVIESKLRQLGA